MQVFGVDPRDVRWEMDAAVYRVYFWESPSHPEGMFTCDERKLTDVDSAAEVLDWAATHANGRDVVVYLELEEQPGATGTDRGLIRLHGHNPNAATSPHT